MRDFTPMNSNKKTLTAILNLFQTLFDTDKQNETVAKCCEKFTSLGGGCHAVTGEGKVIRPSLEFLSSRSFANKFFSPQGEIKSLPLLGEDVRRTGEGKSNVIVKESKKKAAFTLAEVLITIGIIGVVAAITIPALHTKITKIVLKNQIKKAMSLVAQNYRATVDEVGSPSDGMNGSFSYGDFNTAFLNNFKMARICNGNGLRDKCVPEYEGLNVSSCSGFNEANVYNKQTIYVTLEGVIIILYHPTWRSLWLVDVNGMKGPNKAGWDLFQVVMDDSTADRPKWGGRSCINQGSPAISGSITSGDFSFSTLANW